MKTRATPTTDHDRVETYARTNSDGRRELVLYTPTATHEWINAASASVVDLEEHR